MSVSPVLARTRLLLCLAIIVCTAIVGVRPANTQVPTGLQTSPQTTASNPAKRSDNATTTEVSLGFFGQFTPTRAPTTTSTYTTPSGTYTYLNEIRQGTSSSGGIQATFHQQFRRLIGYKVNLGYSRFAEKYSIAGAYPGTTGPVDPFLVRTSIGTNMYEASATAVVQGPRTRRFSTDAQTGVALLTFLPKVRPALTSYQLLPALAFGSGLNFRLSPMFSMRLEYKGLFYRNPEFKFQGPGFSKLFTVTSEPTVSLVYTFGHRPPKAPPQTH